MDELTLWKIRYKYQNKIFPRLAYSLINFLNDNHQNYLDLILSKSIKVEDIIYFLKYREISNEEDLTNWTIRYIEMKHGIFNKS